MTFYLGIDAGGSNCRARLVDGTGRFVGSGRGGPANARIGVDALRDTILDTCRQATDEAGLDLQQVATVHAGLGVAGIGRSGMKTKLEALDLPFASAAFATDAVIANLGAHAGGDGATLIIGTGSIGIVKIGDKTFTIGGYGFPISDEGSGAALGLSVIRHALRALDGRTHQSPLGEAVTKRFGHETAQVVAWMDSATPTEYAQFAPMVMDYAEHGDAIAVSIVREASLHIERFIETIFARGAERCVLVGGLAQRMKPWLRARTADRIVEPLGDALDGALFLAGYRRPG